MASWYETRIDRQLREAQERGDFDNLPGAGEPLPNNGEEYDAEWWLKGLVRRESIAAAGLPPALALRKEIEDLPAALARKRTETAVRQVVTDLNDRILLARRGPVDGPPVAVKPVDVDAVVREWRDARAAAAAAPAVRTDAATTDAATTEAVMRGDAPTRPARRSRWWSRRRA
ncbi:MAG TPA: DUF1992 domain-containing protein [Micromonosporaceae bacterium]|nr:DUF1992 domain-containing protein [Micromonosporaceae bacterium]